MIMAAEQFCDLLSASWRLRKADNVIQSQPENQRNQCCKSQPWGLVVMRNGPAEATKQEIKSQFLLLLPTVCSSTQRSE